MCVLRVCCKCLAGVMLWVCLERWCVLRLVKLKRILRGEYTTFQDHVGKATRRNQSVEICRQSHQKCGLPELSIRDDPMNQTEPRNPEQKEPRNAELFDPELSILDSSGARNSPFRHLPMTNDMVFHVAWFASQ